MSYEKTKITAKRIFKKLKACSYDIRKFNEKFEVSDEEKNAYNKYYGWKFGYL